MNKLKKLGITFGVITFLFIVVVSYSGDSTANNNTDLNVIIPDKVFIPEKISIDERFDPAVVKSAIKNLPAMRDLLKGILEQCTNVKTADDYLVLTTVIGILEEDLADNLILINGIIRDLESKGYDKQPEIGLLINEMKDLADKGGNCFSDLPMKFG